MNLRLAEAQSIRDFLNEHADKLGGRVLDLGCGQQPYRDIIENAGGTYDGHDRPDYPGSVVSEPTEPLEDSYHFHPEARWDTVVMTQVWQYMRLPVLTDLLGELAYGERLLRPGGWLLATGPTNWPVIEKDDLHRFTMMGVLSLLSDAGFPSVEITERHHIEHGAEKWSCGWAVAARSAS